jgi:hypothetical protein
MPPTVEEIRAQVKEIIAAVADLQPDEIDEHRSAPTPSASLSPAFSTVTHF